MKPYPVMVGPTSHLAAERERLAGLEWQHFDVRPLSPTVGGELVGSRSHPSLCRDEVSADVRQALHDYKVIFFRDQPLTAGPARRLRASLRRARGAPFIPSNTGQPELVRFEKSAEVADYENSWHHDVTWRAEPSMGAVLHALSVPELGGDTLFADMYAAYEGLDDETKARIDDLDAVHDYMRSFGAHGAPRTAGRGAGAVPAGDPPGGVPPRGDRPPPPLCEPQLRRPHRRARTRRQRDARWICSAARPTTPSTSAGSAGSRTRSRSGTTGRCSTTRRATTGRRCARWSALRSRGHDPALTDTGR